MRESLLACNKTPAECRQNICCIVVSFQFCCGNWRDR